MTTDILIYPMKFRLIYRTVNLSQLPTYQRKRENQWQVWWPVFTVQKDCLSSFLSVEWSRLLECIFDKFSTSKNDVFRLKDAILWIIYLDKNSTHRYQNQEKSEFIVCDHSKSTQYINTYWDPKKLKIKGLKSSNKFSFIHNSRIWIQE